MYTCMCCTANLTFTPYGCIAIITLLAGTVERPHKVHTISILPALGPIITFIDVCTVTFTCEQMIEHECVHA